MSLIILPSPAYTEAPRPIKITVVGDPTVGKCSLLKTFTQNKFPEPKSSSIFDNYTKIQVVDGVPYNLTLWYTSGLDNYDKIRPLSYLHTDCFLICYAIDNQTSFHNVPFKWIPEVRSHCSETPILLVGTKSDITNSTETNSHVSERQGQLMKSEIRADGFLQCSAKTGEGLDQVFMKSVRLIVKGEMPQKSTCTVS